MKDKRV